jgi:hypothetical protein
MNKKIILFFVAFLAASPAADTTGFKGPTKYSLQIKINGISSVTAILPGTMISFKQMLNSKNGIRISAGTAAGSYDSKDYTSVPENGITNNVKVDSISFSLHATYLKYLYCIKNFYVYGGTGPFGKFSYQEYIDLSFTKVTRNYALGLDGCLGIEWFFTEHFTLFLEYNLFADWEYRHSASDLVNSNVTSPENKTINYNLNYNTVFIGLSIYL